jgi:HTH-type transcriptional regulator/antitoxin MqsA
MEATMVKCRVCGHTAVKSEFVSEVFTIENRRVLVEHIPVQVCGHCGEGIFSRETTEKIRRLLHDAKRPIRTEPLDFFAMA